MDPDTPRTHAFPAHLMAVQARVRQEPRVVALNDWVAAESDERRLRIPWFDPGDAGQAARALFLQASPGRMADAHRGSGLASVDNDDESSAALWHLRHDAGLRDGVVHWNAVPWFVRGELTPGDERRAEPLLRRLLLLLPDLEVVVPMGRVAQRLWAGYTLQRPHQLVTLPTFLPSRRALAAPERRAAVETTMGRVALLLGVPEPSRRPAPEPARAPAVAEPTAPGEDTGFPRLREAIAKIADRALPS